MNKTYIYIMTNKSFEGHNWVKIGYSKDPEKRRSELSNTSLPFGYEIYATYEVEDKNKDKPLHELLTILDPNIRVSRDREFFEMPPEQAYFILSMIARITNTEDKLIRFVNIEKEQTNLNTNQFSKILIADKIIEYLSNRKDIILLTTGNAYQRFTTNNIRQTVGLIGNGKWSGLSDLLAYEIKVFDGNKVTLTLIIGPGNNDIRNEWLQFAIKNGEPFKVKGKTVTFGNWKRIYHKTLCIIDKFKNEEDIANHVLKELKHFFENDFVKFEHLFAE